MNLYKTAIDKNQVFDFYRGKGNYFDLDRDRGIHNSAFTSMQVIGYGTDFGEEKLYNQLNSDLLKYITSDDFSFEDLNVIIGIIWFYFVYRKEEELLKQDWNIPNQLIELFATKMELMKSNGEDLSNIFRVIKNLKERFGYTLTAKFI